MQAPVKMLRSCRQDPAGCVRFDASSGNEQQQSATDDDWDFGDIASGPAEGPAPRVRSDEQILENEESMVLNQLVPGAIGRVPTYASRSSVSLVTAVVAKGLCMLKP